MIHHTFVIFKKKLIKENNRPKGENSLNLVYLSLSYLHRHCRFENECDRIYLLIRLPQLFRGTRHHYTSNSN
jgi:hypothetical protein